MFLWRIAATTPSEVLLLLTKGSYPNEILMADLVTPSPLGCYTNKGFSPIQKANAVIEISEGVVKFPIGEAEEGVEMNAKYFTNPKFKKISVSANGVVETLDPGYDFIRVLADGTEILYAESTQDNSDCGYESKSASVLHTFTECQSCGHEIYIESGLNDDVCNDGVQWTVTLVLS